MWKRAFVDDVHEVGFSGPVCVNSHIFTIVMAVALLGITRDEIQCEPDPLLRRDDPSGISHVATGLAFTTHDGSNPVAWLAEKSSTCSKTEHDRRYMNPVKNGILWLDDGNRVCAKRGSFPAY